MRFADCTPILLVDPRKGGVGMAHAGWRGTVQGVSAALVHAMQEAFDSRSSDLVAGIDARGFLLGGAVAHRLGIGVLAIRKGGKLPPPVIDVAYDLEYGSGVLEMQTGQGRLLLIDDVLATGGTLDASVVLCRRAGYVVHGIGVLLDIGLVPGYRCAEFTPRSVIQYG